MLLSAILGLEADAEQRRLAIHSPMLPSWLQYVELHGLRLEEQSVSLRFEHQDNGVAVAPLGTTDVELSILA